MTPGQPLSLEQVGEMFRDDGTATEVSEGETGGDASCQLVGYVCRCPACKATPPAAGVVAAPANEPPCRVPCATPGGQRRETTGAPNVRLGKKTKVCKGKIELPVFLHERRGKVPCADLKGARNP